MAMTNTSGAALLSSAEVDALLIRPAFAASIAAQVARTAVTRSATYRLPYVSGDPTAAWVNEGAEITPTDATLAEIVVTPSKVAGLTIVSRELAEDSNPSATSEIGLGLARDIARQIDAAFFGTVASPAPSGLGALAGTTAIAAGAAWANLDPFEAAVSGVEQVNASITAWVAGPAAALALAQLKQATGSNVPLLAADPTQPARRTIAGRPLFVSSAVPLKTVYGISGDRAVIVVRRDANIEADRSVFFTSDRVAVKGTMRVGFGFPHPAAVAKVTIT